MAIALIVLLLLETAFQLVWVGWYFATGIRVFEERIRAPAAVRSRLTLNSLERNVAPDKWIDLVFRTLPDGQIAFRESFFPSGSRRYYLVMRGRVEVDARRGEVRVVGLCNWNVLFIGLAVFPAIAMKPAAAAMLAVFPLFLISYLIQKRRFAGVAEAIRQQLADEQSVEVLMARRLQAERLH